MKPPEDHYKSITQMQTDLKAIEQSYDRLLNFALSFLSPEENGLAVSAYIRDEARMALGRKPVETKVSRSSP